MSGRPYFITTPIYYVNDLPHLGHAYTTVACDALARFMRLDGRHVIFLTGTDEHGQKVEQSARAAGDVAAGIRRPHLGAFRDMTRLLNISHDDFIRTTEPRHTRAVQAIWRELERRGEIYLGRFAGWYSVRDEAFYEESELVDGKAPTGADVEWLEEENYFFRLSAWQDRLLAFYERKSRCSRAAQPPQRGDQLCQRRAQGPVDLAHQLHLGHSGPGRSPSMSSMSGSTR